MDIQGAPLGDVMDFSECVRRGSRRVAAGLVLALMLVPVIFSTDEARAAVADDRVVTASRTVSRWMNRLTDTDYRRLRKMSASTAYKYADYLVKVNVSGRSGWRVTREATRVTALGNRLYRTNMKVNWRVDGRTIELRQFVYRDRPGSPPEVVRFTRDDRPLRAYIKTGGRKSGYGLTTKLEYVFRRANLDRPTLVAVLRVKNKRTYPTCVDDQAAPLIIRNGAVRYAEDGFFPCVAPGRSRTVILDYARVPQSQRGGWVTFMAYGPSGSEYEYENYVRVPFGRWPRS